MQSIPSKIYLTGPQVRARFGNVSAMTLWRWQRDPKLEFPTPIKINRRKLFNLEEVEKWERETAVRGGR